MNQNITEYKTMQGENKEDPIKDWTQTSNGYYIVPIDKLEVKGAEKDSRGMPNLKALGKTIVRCKCPDCSDSRKHNKEYCARLDLSTGMGKCYNCGFRFIIGSMVNDYNKKRGYQKTKFKLPDTSKLKPLDQVCIDVLLKRKIQPQTASKAGVRSANRVFSGCSLERSCLAFTYREGSKVVNIQYKSTSKDFQIEPNCELIPWNIDAAIGQESLIITEGMMDALALMECGFDNVISVSNGAETDMRTFDRFRYSHLDHIRTFYLAGDMDEPGLELRNKMATYFGEARCRIVEWRTEHENAICQAKDANEMLIEYGVDAVLQCINHAQPCPIIGVETVDDYRERTKQIWENGITPGKTVGWGEFDNHIQFEPGRTVIIVGEPNTGKSTFADDLILNLALQHGWKAALYSPEMFPPERHIERLATTIAGRKFRKEQVTTERGIDYRKPLIPERMADHILDWLSENIFFITETSGRTIHKLLHRAEQLQMRYGITQLLLDPFNYIQLPEGAKSDTMKIGDILAEIELCAHRTGLLIFVIVHPAKLQKGEKIESLYNASGSAEFRNRADYGLVLLNDDEHCAMKSMHQLKIIVDKVRDDAMGHKGVCYVSFDPLNYRHGIVQPEYYNGSVVKLNMLDISSHCWLDQAEQIEIF